MFGVLLRPARAALVRLVFDFLAFGAIERQAALGRRQRIAGLADQHFVRHRHLVEPDAEPRAILLRLAGRVVVHLPVDVLAGGNALADVGAMRDRRRGPAPTTAACSSPGSAVLSVRRQAARSAIADRPCRPCRSIRPFDERRAFGDVDEEDAGVVHDGAVARPELERPRRSDPRSNGTFE